MPDPKKGIAAAVEAVRKMREAAEKAAAELAAERARVERGSHPKG